MLPLGLSAPAHKLALPLWGFSHLGRQTERERIPKPRYYFFSKTKVTSAWSHLVHSRDTQVVRRKFLRDSVRFDDPVSPAVARNPNQSF
jgi:hypothetical protein